MTPKTKSRPIELSIGAKEPPGPGRINSSHGGGKNDCAGLEYGGQSSLKDSLGRSKSEKRRYPGP